MIGAFHQPVSVVMDTDTLRTLPAREFAAGLAEVIKYGVIIDGAFFAWLEQHLEQVLALEPQAVTYCLRRCCELKAQVVAADETEQGQRALLNLGHTFGHAIEAEMGYGVWLHGEAVAAGMMMAMVTSRHLGLATDADVARLRALLQRAGLPVQGPAAMAADAYLPHMLRDKKVLAGTLRLVLPHGIGQASVVSGTDQQVVLAAIAECRG